MSADYRTASFKGYGHPTGAERPASLHVAYADDEHGLGAFSLAEIGELAALAGQAWPDGEGVEVRYVIEQRRPRSGWMPVWSAVAGEDDAEYLARSTYESFANAGSLYRFRLVCRTTVTADEILRPEP